MDKLYYLHLSVHFAADFCSREVILSATTFGKRGDSHLPGSSLRNEAASYLQAIHGNARVEAIADGKKVDIHCRVIDFGKETDLFVEVKDHAENLTRKEVVHICADYSQIVATGRSGRLLIVTRVGLSPTAQVYVDSQPMVFHQTIWELEDAALGLLPYVQAQSSLFDEEGLSEYYVPARARRAHYDEAQSRSLDNHDLLLFEEVESWINERGAPPLAILGGYGAGKSSFARRLVASQARKALADPAERRPVLIKLGNVTRSAGLDSLLGSLFTSEFEIRGYSFRRFRELNEKGRLVIVLDGFDEMKHAMTWTEFRNQIHELNELNAGSSKIVLLGRPTAFTSDDEHLEVLRGMRRSADGIVRRLQDWPEFREFELEPFTREERRTFVTRFLSAAAKHRVASSLIDSSCNLARLRADEINRLADQEEEVFGKPVHARILVELALDPDFDLTSLAEGVTRWTLYAEFFSLLARRETKKPARSPIEAPYRLEFLRRTGLWLWQHRDGATSFRAADLPRSVLDDLPDGDTDTLEDKRREYLAGAFLERKANDTYFFPHRSFAEYLVAEHLALNPPGPSEHHINARLVRGGISDFLRAAPQNQQINLWSRTLSSQSGHLPIEYFLFLAEAAGGYAEMAAIVPEGSPWRPLVALLATPPECEDERAHIVADAILKENPETGALLLSALSRFPELLDPSAITRGDEPLAGLTPVIAAALITRVIGSLRESAPLGRQTVKERGASSLKIAQEAISIEQGEQSRYITFSWRGLGDATASILDASGPKIYRGSSGYYYHDAKDIRLTYFEVRNLMNDRISEFFHQMVLKGGSLKTISVVSHVERRGAGGRHGVTS